MTRSALFPEDFFAPCVLAVAGFEVETMALNLVCPV